MSSEIYYRPPWTCGKYNADKHVAIMFNLLEDIDYFFEKEAADVIGYVLATEKGNAISVKNVSDLLQIAPISINNFFNKLENYGLLSFTPITDAIVDEYRNECKKKKPFEVNHNGPLEKESRTTAEDAYCKAVSEYDTITTVMFELTYRCSESCIHCYNPGATRNDSEKSKRGALKELTLEEYKRIIDELCDAGLVIAAISGGDPFSYPHVWKILEYLYQKDVAIKLFTNGLRLNGNVNRLAKLYPRDVRISVYSGIENIHDGITRVDNSLKKTLNTIEQLINQSIHVTINCPVMTRNVQSYTTVKEIGKKYNTDIVFDYNILDSMDGDVCATRNLRLSQDQMEVILQDKDIGGYISKDIPETLEGNKSNTTDGVPCEAGVSMFCIKPNGDLIPCCSLHLPFGNLKKNHLSAIFSNSDSLRKWKSMKISDFKECWKHDYCAYCDMCIGINYSEHKSPFIAGENNCFIAKCKYDLVKKIKANAPLMQNIENNKDCDRELYRQYRKG